VGKWRRRFIDWRIAGLPDELRPGKPRSIEAERLAELIHKPLHTKPATGKHWSGRDMALETGISKSAVHRFWPLFGLKPQRPESFKLSTEPGFIEKVRDVVGLYLT
jgi:transposase